MASGTSNSTLYPFEGTLGDPDTVATFEHTLAGFHDPYIGLIHTGGADEVVHAGKRNRQRGILGKEVFIEMVLIITQQTIRVVLLHQLLDKIILGIDENQIGEQRLGHLPALVVH